MRGWWMVVLAGCGFDLKLQSGVDIDAQNGSDAPGGDATADAPLDTSPMPVDAPVQLLCPNDYNVTIAATQSKYRFKKTGGSPTSQALDCQNDGTGTHIASLDSQAEITQLAQQVSAATGWATVPEHPNDTYVFVGGVQRANATQLDANWITVAGVAQVSSWGPDEPNDWDDTENVEDGEEQFLVLWRDESKLADMVGRFAYGVICECDGLTPSTAFATAFASAVQNSGGGGGGGGFP